MPGELEDRVLAWIADDPDQTTRAQLQALLDAAAYAELAERFSGPLEFGTAGLRGPMRAGENGMNRAVVSRAAAGLARYLDDIDAAGPVVIGYDARHGSHRFALDTAEIVQGTGRTALLLPRPLPTPVLAYAVGALQAAAGVMVTASHNPPQDNGYKVYLGGAGLNAQIVPPADSLISAAIAAVTTLGELPRSSDYQTVGEEVYQRYLQSTVDVLDPASPRELSVVSTALHGVGGQTLLEAFARAGFASPLPVAHQQRPNPEFPGLAFPNPEEPGVMDDVITMAVAQGADLALANDPDADRCAAAAPMREGWRALRGDELGVLLADHLMRRGVRGTYATTIVSSSMLEALCARRGVPFAATLTGFKWIVRAPEETGVPLRFGYEEAIGYAVDPASVNDKDGISAALLTAELAAGLKAAGSSLQERLDELYGEVGHHLTAQISVRVDDLSLITATMARLRGNPPAAVGPWPVTVTDLLPATDALILRSLDVPGSSSPGSSSPASSSPGSRGEIGTQGAPKSPHEVAPSTSTAEQVRVVVRPSGTEPKLKAYLEVVQPSSGDPVADGAAAAERMATLHAAVTALVT